MVEGSKFLVNVFYSCITDLFKDVAIVIKAKRVINTLKYLVDPFSNVNFDLSS